MIDLEMTSSGLPRLPCFRQSPVWCLRRSMSSGKLDFLGDEFPVSLSTALCPQCFNMFRADLLFRCSCGIAIAAFSFPGAVITWETVSEESGFPSYGLGS